MFLGRKIHIVKISFFLKIIYKSNTFSVEIPVVFCGT